MNNNTKPITIIIAIIGLTVGILSTVAIDHKAFGMTDKQRFDQGKSDFVLGKGATLKWALGILSYHPFIHGHSIPYQNGFIADINTRFGTHIPYYDFDQSLLVNVPGKVVHLNINLYKP